MSTMKQRKTMPRRTEEFDFSAPQSSVKKLPAQRLSRIAQPIRKLSTKTSLGNGLNENGRSLSNDRFNMPQQTPLTVRKVCPSTRSSSATPSARTPLRSCENAPTASMGTVEKDKAPIENREWITAQCERICDYLTTIGDLPHDFVERRNLKSMSMKQFLVIMNHLFRQIGGSRYKLGNNFIDDIMKTMAELEYPYTINKSMLKTPNAPHSINHIIVMIGWLMQLAPEHDGKCTPLERDSDLLVDFPSSEYQEFFLEKVQEGFNVWNLKKENEFGALLEQLIDGLVMARTSGLNQQQINGRITELENELQEIHNRTIQHDRKQSLNQLEKAIHEQQLVQKKFSDELKTIQRQAEKMEEDYYRHQEEYYSLVKQTEALKQEVDSQQFDADGRVALVKAITTNKSLLTAKRIAVATLEHNSHEHQITISRLIKKKCDLFSTLNTKLYQFSDYLRPTIDFNPPNIDLKTQDYDELQKNLIATKSLLADVLSRQTAELLALNAQKSKLEHDISDTQIKYTSVEKSLLEATARYESLLKQRELIVNQLGEISANESRASQRLDEDGLQLEGELTRLREQCDQNRKAMEKLTQDKQKLMIENLEKSQRVLNEKKRLQKQMTEQIEELESVMASIENDVSRMKW
ncbi:kinetochore protein NDC80 homolog [Toxorhynchites rutilus septentrionalis]|uniref:kinetochore protein NDC80 homolog n=1 Tax=Toxorhynchites rutilus septentrionalis TaxID=329112 RepID=UPI00247AE1E7|nr:kinetochore protein NDC80 homolog [Toxorhynchites rutilus septentrionalis]